MNHLCAYKWPDTNRWEYCRNGVPTGYCREYKPLGGPMISPALAEKENEKMEPLRGNFHTDGHATKEEAEECYARYLLDTSLRLQTTEPDDAEHQEKCEICGAWTTCFARVGAYRAFVLCPAHQTKEAVRSLFRVGERWES